MADWNSGPEILWTATLLLGRKVWTLPRDNFPTLATGSTCPSVATAAMVPNLAERAKHAFGSAKAALLVARSVMVTAKELQEDATFVGPI